MKAVLAFDAGYLGTRVGAFRGATGDVAFVPICEDPFCAGESLLGGVPGIVALPAGPLAAEYPWHPRNLAIERANGYCASRGIPCLVVGEERAAELPPPACYSGWKDYRRRAAYFSVPQTDALEKAALTLGKEVGTANVITVYLGDEAAVSSHRGGTLVDTSDPAACEGPFGFTSAGTVPATAFVAYAAAFGVRGEQGVALRLRSKIKSRSGVFAYAGVESLDALTAAIDAGSEGAVQALRAMSYQVSKEVGRHFGVLSGRVDCVALCGPGTSIRLLTDGITERVGKWAPVLSFTEDLTMGRLHMEGTKALSQN